MRSAEDRLLDMTLLVYLLHGAGDVAGRAKVQKTVFLTEFALANARQPVVPHYKYFRYNNGPFSKQVWDDCDDLMALGFLDCELFAPTARGDFLLELVLPEIRGAEEWAPILAIVDQTLDYCRPRTGAQLIEEVYDLRLTLLGSSRSEKIRNIPLNIDLIDPPSGGPTLPAWLLDTVREELGLTSEALAESIERVRGQEAEIRSRISR